MARKTHTIQTIEVSGHGEFPWDMLRYDMACPVGSVDMDKLMALMEDVKETGWADGIAYDDPIRLHVFQPGGATVARWFSFGWTVREVV